MQYDVFISYRREGGFETAKLLTESLVKLGYTVSFDLETLHSGNFDKELYKRIEDCSDFILIVDRNCFDKTLDKNIDSNDDWVRREVAYALSLKRNIIVVRLDGAVFPPDLPSDIAEISKKNGPEYSISYYDSFVSRLTKDFLRSAPRNLKTYQYLLPEKTDNQYQNSFLKIKSDLDCMFYLDGDFMMFVTGGKIEKLPLGVGDCELKFVSIENEADCIVDVFNMGITDKMYTVNLCEVRKARIEKEEKEKREREERERIQQERLEQERKEQERKDRERIEHERMLAERRAKKIAEMGAVNGIFSASPKKQILFSKGNIQYQASTRTWRFAEHQYDYKGIANCDISQKNQDWIDLFGWGTGSKPTKTSLKSDDYGSIVDWGRNTIANGGSRNNLWRTLNIAEWKYLFLNRETASGIYFAKAKVNEVNGVLLFPDNWNEAAYNIKKPNQGNAEYISNRITATDWKTLELYGLVFLPAAGYRGGTTVNNAGSFGYYWSASYYISKCAFSLDFSDSNLNLDSNFDRSYGRSVRLVCDAF